MSAPRSDGGKNVPPRTGALTRSASRNAEAQGGSGLMSMMRELVAPTPKASRTQSMSHVSGSSAQQEPFRRQGSSSQVSRTPTPDTSRASSPIQPAMETQDQTPILVISQGPAAALPTAQVQPADRPASEHVGPSAPQAQATAPPAPAPTPIVPQVQAQAARQPSAQQAQATRQGPFRRRFVPGTVTIPQDVIAWFATKGVELPQKVQNIANLNPARVLANEGRSIDWIGTNLSFEYEDPTAAWLIERSYLQAFFARAQEVYISGSFCLLRNFGPQEPTWGKSMTIINTPSSDFLPNIEIKLITFVATSVPEEIRHYVTRVHTVRSAQLCRNGTAQTEDQFLPLRERSNHGKKCAITVLARYPSTPRRDRRKRHEHHRPGR
jgi:hypothetical protein